MRQGLSAFVHIFLKTDGRVLICGASTLASAMNVIIPVA